MEIRYQIFISSTFEDLKKERQAVFSSVLDMNHMPAGMELFPASNATPWEQICSVIDSSDYYVLIVAGRYGSIDEEGLSYTEKEYQYAISKGIPAIIFLYEEPENLPRTKTDKNDKAWQKLENFRKTLKKSHLCKFWNTVDELSAKLIISLTKTFKQIPRTGWVRSDTIASEEASREIIELRKIIDIQKEQIEKSKFYLTDYAKNLAQGNDIYDLKVNMTYTDKDKAYSDPRKHIKENKIVKVSWDNLFLSFAPVILDEVQLTKMKTSITTYIVHQFFQDEISTNKISHNAITIHDTVFQQIKVQFIALGLIQLNTVLREKNSLEKKEVVLCSLTDKGKEYLLKNLAIRRS